MYQNKLGKTKSILHGHNSKEVHLQKTKITKQQSSLPSSSPQQPKFNHINVVKPSNKYLFFFKTEEWSQLNQTTTTAF